MILLLPGGFFIATKLGGNIYMANTGHLRESAFLFYIIFFISYCHKLGRNIYVTSMGSPQGKCNFAKVVVVCCFLSQTAVKQLIKTRANENCPLSMKKVKLFKPAKTSKAWVKFRCNSGQNNVI